MLSVSSSDTSSDGLCQLTARPAAIIAAAAGLLPMGIGGGAGAGGGGGTCGEPLSSESEPARWRGTSYARSARKILGATAYAKLTARPAAIIAAAAGLLPMGIGGGAGAGGGGGAGG
jgi:hypothetical protein